MKFNFTEVQINNYNHYASKKIISYIIKINKNTFKIPF